MRYRTKIDDRSYAIDLANKDLLMLDRVALELATLIAQKIYGKRRGVCLSVIEALTGRRHAPHRSWVFEAVVASQDKMGKTLEWQEIPFKIEEIPTPPPRQPKAKTPIATTAPTLADILNDHL